MMDKQTKRQTSLEITTLYKSIIRKRLKYLLMNPVTGVSSSLTDELNFRIKGLGNLSSFFMVLSGDDFISVPTVSRDGFESCLLLPNCSRLWREETILEEVSDSSVCKKKNMKMWEIKTVELNDYIKAILPIFMLL